MRVMQGRSSSGAESKLLQQLGELNRTTLRSVLVVTEYGESDRLYQPYTPRSNTGALIVSSTPETGVINMLVPGVGTIVACQEPVPALLSVVPDPVERIGRHHLVSDYRVIHIKPAAENELGRIAKIEDYQSPAFIGRLRIRRHREPQENISSFRY